MEVWVHLWRSRSELSTFVDDLDEHCRYIVSHDLVDSIWRLTFDVRCPRRDVHRRPHRKEVLLSELCVGTDEVGESVDGTVSQSRRCLAQFFAIRSGVNSRRELARAVLVHELQVTLSGRYSEIEERGLTWGSPSR